MPKSRQSESSVTLQGALVLRISVIIVGHCSSFSVQTEAFVSTWQPIEVALKELLKFAPTTTRSRTHGWIRRKNAHPLPLHPSKCPLSPSFRQLIDLFVNPLQSSKSLFIYHHNADPFSPIRQCSSPLHLHGLGGTSAHDTRSLSQHGPHRRYENDSKPLVNLSHARRRQNHNAKPNQSPYGHKVGHQVSVLLRVSTAL
jgi:hypothetical protein